ncbi:MAG: septum formation initiator family protein [Spirochaetota bacterium]
MQIRKNRSTILVIIYVLFAVYFFVFGDTGILERIQLVKQEDGIKQNIAELKKENSDLQKEFSTVSNRQTNGNFYKQEAARSGFIAGGEKYIFFKSSGKVEKVNAKSAVKDDEYPVELSHLRILWIVISAIVLLFYFWNRKKQNMKAESE